MATWPGSLPQSPLISGYTETALDDTIRTEMDTGPSKMRSRTGVIFREFTIAMNMTEAQVTTFETFYNTTLAYGTLPFDWVLPRIGTVTTLYFIERGTYSPLSHNIYHVTFKLELAP